MALQEWVIDNFTIALVGTVFLGIVVGDVICAVWQALRPPRPDPEPKDRPPLVVRVRRSLHCVRHRGRPWWI